MILHLVKCDMCDDQFPFQPMLHPISEATPDMWFTVFRGKPDGQEPRYFCSLTCLRSWVRDRTTANDIPLTQDTPHEPYPYCCPKHFPLGGPWPKNMSMPGGNE